MTGAQVQDLALAQAGREVVRKPLEDVLKEQRREREREVFGEEITAAAARLEARVQATKNGFGSPSGPASLPPPSPAAAGAMAGEGPPRQQLPSLFSLTHQHDRDVPPPPMHGLGKSMSPPITTAFGPLSRPRSISTSSTSGLGQPMRLVPVAKNVENERPQGGGPTGI